MNPQNNNLSAAAVLPRRSRRLATIIPASHWISMGYSQEDAQALEGLQQDMKKYCDDGLDGTNIKIVGKGSGDEVLPHNDMMLPHWQKFANVLRGRMNADDVLLHCVSLPVSVLDIIFPAFQSTNLTGLSLCRTEFENGGWQHLSSFLKINTSLDRLFLGGDLIDDVAVASSLSDAIKSHPNLVMLAFSRCGLNNTPILREILEGCTRVTAFGLTMDNIGSEGTTLISEFIEANYPIQYLNLDRNMITDNDTLVLASALKNNDYLEKLVLTGNDITEEGEKQLLKALYNPTNMDSIVDSNHICEVYTYDTKNPLVVSQRPPIETEVLNVNADDEKSLQELIRKKVILALCGVDGGLFDLSHFNGLPLKLMPRVLELIQEHSKSRTEMIRNIPIEDESLFLSVEDDCYYRKQLEKDALSRLYHTLRAWELPLLFENLHTSSNGAGTKRKRRKTRR